MSRFVVVRNAVDGNDHVVSESVIPSEELLHKVLMGHPSLVPATDLGFGRTVTVGYETHLASGYADLILADDEGQLCLVEVKKEGNTDTRRVIAQLMDYAAGLWGMTLEQFETQVLRPMLEPADRRDRRTFLTEKLFGTGEEPDEAADRLLERLAETLRSGAFSLVVAAPLIPEGIQRVIEYLNARGLSLYGLEVSYFAGEVEVFVPRIVAKPTASGRIAGQDTRDELRPAIELGAYLDRVPEPARDLVARFLETVPELGGEFQWRATGPTVRVACASGMKAAVGMDATQGYLHVGLVAGREPGPAEAARQRVRGIPSVGSGDTFPSISWKRTTPADVERFLAVATDFVRDLVRVHRNAASIPSAPETAAPVTADD